MRIRPDIKGFAKEIYMDKRIEQLTLIYRTTQKKLARIVRSVGVTDLQRTRASVLLVQVNREIAILNKRSKKWASKTMPVSYAHGLDITEERLRALGITKYVNMSAKIHTGAVNVLIDDVTVDLLVANQTMKKNVVRYIHATQQQALEDKQISRLIADGLIQGQTRKEISGRIQTQFEKLLKEEKFITINGRNYRPDAYSRLVARTRTLEASNQANVNATLQYGLDLVQVDIHAGSCDICDPFQGKIYSISGNDTEFPALDERPPYHPNCRHVLLAMTRESLEERGILDGSIKYSNASTAATSISKYEEVINV